MTSSRLRSIDLRPLVSTSFKTMCEALSPKPADLPMVNLDIAKAGATAGMAIASWRWDVAGPDQFSMNVAAAVCAAIQRGHSYLLLDLVSIDQRSDTLAQDVQHFGRYYGKLPVIAAYDVPGEANWLMTMRRPWIFSEVRATHGNENPITYASHQTDQGGESSFGYAHMLDRVLHTSYTSTLLLLLFGYVGMTDLADLKYIIPGHLRIAEACHHSMSRNDYLLTLAILGHTFTDDFGFNVLNDLAEMDLRLPCFERYRLTRTDGSDRAYKYYAISLDGARVATYWGRTKLDRMTMAPTYVCNLEPEPNAGGLLHDMFCPEEAAAYRAAAGNLKSLLAIPNQREFVNVRTLYLAS